MIYRLIICESSQKCNIDMVEISFLDVFYGIFVSINKIHSSTTDNFIHFYSLHLTALSHKIYMEIY